MAEIKVRLIHHSVAFLNKVCLYLHTGRNAYHYVQSHRSTVAAFESSVGAGQVDVSQFGTVLKSGWGDYPSDNVVKQVDEMLINNAKKDPRVDSSALHLAVYKEKTECVRLLLEFGAAVNLRDCFGLTPLHLAAMRGNTSMVKMFEDNGADFSIEDNQQQTPLDVARLNKHTITMDFIGQKCCVNTVQVCQKHMYYIRQLHSNILSTYCTVIYCVEWAYGEFVDENIVCVFTALLSP